jgi:hypothetical protein
VLGIQRIIDRLVCANLGRSIAQERLPKADPLAAKANGDLGWRSDSSFSEQVWREAALLFISHMSVFKI